MSNYNINLHEAIYSLSDALDLLVQGSGTRSAGLSAGRNMSLADPESAYKMMTLIFKRAIRFIDDNRDSLRAEFGTGDAARPVGQVAQALAAYNSTYGV